MTVEQELTEGTEGLNDSTKLTEVSVERFSVISVCSCSMSLVAASGSGLRISVIDGKRVTE